MTFSRFLLPLGCGCLLAAAGARAQQTPPALPNFTPPPPPPNMSSASVPGLPSNPTSTPSGEENVRLLFNNSPLSDVLNFYAELTGKRVLTDSTISGNAALTFDISKSVPRSEAIRIIETVLNLNGYSMVPGDGNIVKVLGPSQIPRARGTPIFSDLANVPRGEQVVSFLLRLRYLDPIETAGVLTQYIPGGNQVNFTALPKAGALIATADASTIRRLVELVNSLDQPLAPVEEKWIRLERATATKAIEFLNSVFDSKSASTGTSSGNGSPGATTNNTNPRRPIRRVEDGQIVTDPAFTPVTNNTGSGNSPITLSGDSIIQGRITLTADERTNRVHVVTSPLNMPIVEHLLAEYDADTPFASPVPRPLKFINATDVLPILVDALKEPGTDSNGSTSTSSSTGTSGGTTSRSNNNNSFGNNSSNSFGGSTGSNGSYGSSSGSTSSIGDSQLNTQPVDTKPAIAIVGSTKIIADARVNTILVLGSGEARDKVFSILDRLDVRAPQVVIRTVIGELALGKNNELGFNYLLRSNRGSILSQYNPGFIPGTTTTTTNSSATGIGTGTVGSVTPTTTTSSVLNSFTSLATGLGSLGSTFSGVGGVIAIGKSFDIILSALESTTRFKTISRPMIFTSNNKEAIIASGQQIAVPTQTVSSVTTGLNNTGLTSNVEYKDVVLELEVVPLINSENEVTLDIVQRIDNVVPGSTTTIAGNAVPTIATRKLKSTVSAPNNSTIVLGGLITQDSSRTDNNIPYLSRIPILGNLFRSRTRGGDRSELIILMHPEVVNTPAMIARLQQDEGRRTYLGGNIEQQLLPATVKKATAVTTTTTRVVPGDAKDGTRTRRERVRQTTTRTTIEAKKEPDLDHFWITPPQKPKADKP